MAKSKREMRKRAAEDKENIEKGKNVWKTP